MNLRLTLILITVLAMVAGYIVFIELKKPSDKEVDEPYFYNVAMDAIKLVRVTYSGTTQGFKYDETNRRWAFEDEVNTPVNNDRWSGIPLLLTGPRVSRILPEPSEGPPLSERLPEFGLDNPSTTIEVGLNDGRGFKLLLGKRAPDGNNIYSIREGSPQIALVNSSWSDVINRLVQEPPYLPIPTPAVCATPAPTVAPVPTGYPTAPPCVTPTPAVTPTP